MAKPNKLPDFKKMYPEASEEVITALRKGERKMQYQEFDLKAERTVIDKKTNTVITLPSREDSLERLKDLVYSIADESPGTEEQAIQNVQNEQLHQAISRLSKEEQYLIKQLFFEDHSERDLAQELHLTQKGINKRKSRIIKQLGELMKNI